MEGKPKHKLLPWSQIATMALWLVGMAMMNALAYYWQTDRATQIAMVELKKDVQSISRSIDRMERRLDILESKVDVAYSRGEAEREFNQMFGLIEGLAGRVARIEGNGNQG